MPKTPDYFDGKTIFITGAASGIGRETAHIFAREGANVTCADVNAEGAAAVADEIKASGGQAIATSCDVTNTTQVKDAVAKTLDIFGGVNFQFNSAGSAIRRSSFLEIEEDLWDRAFDLNAKSVFTCMQAVLPHMLDHGNGVIVNVA